MIGATSSGAAELLTFPVKAGKEARAEEWLRLLAERRQECLATLDREGAHLEAIFQSMRGNRLYLTLLAIYGEGGPRSATPPLPIDQLYREFWDECIDSDVAPEEHAHVLSLTAAEVATAIACRDAAFAPAGG